MINWDETFKRFGYKESDFIPNKLKIVLICDDCKGEVLGTREKHTRLRRLNGVFRCEKCCKIASIKAIRERWKDPEYIIKQKSKRHSNEYKKIASDRSKKLWNDNNYKEKYYKNYNPELARFNILNVDRKYSYMKFIEYVNKNRDKISARVSNENKEKWKDITYRNNCINKLKIYYSDINVLNKSSEMSKNRWKNPEYRNKCISNIIKSFTNNRLLEISKKSLENWSNINYREKIVRHWTEDKRKWMSNICSDWWTDENKKYISECVTNFWKNENNKAMFIAAFKKAWTNDRRKKASNRWTDEMRKEASNKSRKLWEKPEYVAKMLAMIARPSSLEIRLSKIFDDNNIKYKTQSHIGPYLFDFELDNGNFVEVQGDYWHTLKKAIIKDNSKRSYIINNFPGRKIYYIWEHEFYEDGSINNFINRIKGCTKIIDFNFNDVVIDSSVDNNDAKYIVEKFHYKGAVGRFGINIGAKLNNKLIAVAIFANPTRNVFGGELTRFVIDQEYQKKNFASWFLSRATNIAIKKYKYLFTFADTNYSHDGTIYKASNWRYVGDTEYDYWYVSKDGWVMHKKTLWNRAKNLMISENEYADKFNYVKVWGFPKKKFEFGKI